MFMRGRPITMFIPSDVDNYDDIRAELPPEKLRLEWVYPFFTMTANSLASFKKIHLPDPLSKQFLHRKVYVIRTPASDPFIYFIYFCYQQFKIIQINVFEQGKQYFKIITVGICDVIAKALDQNWKISV